ncbi:hypothetical protein RJ641_012931 [Dillenia turbinata]|uniref:Uncharacterized protein n=1 Tax=Dillenia turbinata TaxID=194707 RepID=A0AAN8Z103_9MAGN
MDGEAVTTTTTASARERVEEIEVAIRELMELTGNKHNASSDGVSLVADDDDQERRQLLSRLLSQLESLKGDISLQEPNLVAQAESVASPAVVIVKTETGSTGETNVGRNGPRTEDIVKELNHVKRQNTITHGLVSLMIVLTVVWQLSEVSLILKVKNTLSNPFKTIGGLFKGMLKGPDRSVSDAEKQSSSDENGQSQNSPHPLPLPELPDIPILGGNDKND